MMNPFHNTVRGVKAVKQNITLPPSLLSLLETFRRMVNDCVRIGLRENVTSLKSLSLKSYKELSSYKVPSYYKLCAISTTVGMLRNHRKAKRKNPHVKTPYARRPMLTTCYGFKIIGGSVRLPVEPRRYEYLPLNSHALEVLSDPNVDVRSVTLTPHTISINFSKETAEIECMGQMGVDRNLDNVTTATATNDGKTNKVKAYDLSKVTLIKATYREVKSHFKRNDARIRKKIYQKYGQKERARVNQILHHTSKEIVKEAKALGFRIVMEKLTGIRKLYRKGNGQGKDYRAKMNSWSFRELQRQIEYKAKWEGIPVVYVNPRGTSKKCSICGSDTRMGMDRRLWCPKCHLFIDRDENSARNLSRGLRFSPFALQVKR